MDNGNSSGIVPVMPMGNSGCGWGDNSFMWIFALLILTGIGNGGFWGGNNFANAIGYENLATENSMQRGFDNQNLQAQTRDILGAVTSGTAQTIAASTANATNAINAIKDGNAALIREFGNVETSLTALGGTLQECCCNQLRAIDGVNYNAAMNTAAIKEAILLDGQKTRDLLTTDKIEALQSKVNALELAQATNGMVRYPNTTVYSAGYNPFYGPVPPFGPFGGNI